MSKKFFPSIQVLRGIASLMVVYHHLWPAMAYFLNVDQEFIHYWAGKGKLGVDFFFVLSGFIIYYTNFAKEGGVRNFKVYSINRIIRVYIPYLPICLLMILAYSVLPSLSQGDRDANIFKSITLLPIEGDMTLSVAWTLSHEMFFYLLFSLWFYSKRALNVLLIIWSAAIIFVEQVPGFFGELSFPVEFLFSNYNIEFTVGVLLAYILRKELFKSRLMLLGLLIIITFGFYWLMPDSKLFYAFLFGSVLIGALDSPLDRLGSKNLLMLIGNSSYSLYLIHNPLLSILVRIAPAGLLLAYHIGVFLVIMAICVIFGIIYYRVFEKWLMGKVKQWLMSKV